MGTTLGIDKVTIRFKTFAGLDAIGFHVTQDGIGESASPHAYRQDSPQWMAFVAMSLRLGIRQLQRTTRIFMGFAVNNSRERAIRNLKLVANLWRGKHAIQVANSLDFALLKWCVSTPIALGNGIKSIIVAVAQIQMRRIATWFIAALMQDHQIRRQIAMCDKPSRAMIADVAPRTIISQ